MTNPQHPITPPPELVQQWNTEGRHQDYCTLTEYIAARATQWGADQELDACCHEVQDMYSGGSRLRAARRPKLPSLKEQALGALETLNQAWTMPKELEAVIAIRRALEALPND
jgi:hypothetical protein